MLPPGVSASLSHGLPWDGKSVASQRDGLFYEQPSILPTVKPKPGDFPGGPVAKAPSSQCRGPLGSIPGQGTRSHMPPLRDNVLQLNIPDPVCPN